MTALEAFLRKMDDVFRLIQRGKLTAIDLGDLQHLREELVAEWEALQETASQITIEADSAEAELAELKHLLRSRF